MTPPGRAVASEEWRDSVSECVQRGFAMLDLLTAVDRGEAVEVVVHLVRPGDGAGEFLHVRVTTGTLPSLAGILPASAWPEREVHEMFGLEFAGHPDLRPLLLSPGAPPTPLRKGAALDARVTRAWPGTSGEPQGRRGRKVPGVRPEWVSG